MTHRQLPLALRFPQGARFDRYAPDGNEAVVAALRAFAEAPAAPGALLVGASGTGKTHLAMAVVAANATATLLPLAEFAARAEAALSATTARALVVIDDVDAIAGQRSAEIALFDLFNRTRDSGGALLVTAPVNVPRLGLVLPDLASRLASLSQLNLQPLDDAARRRVIHARGAAFVRDPAQHEGEFGDAQGIADPERFTIGPVIECACRRIVAQQGILAQQLVQARRNRESVLGKPYGRDEQAFPLQFAVPAMRFLQHRQQAGDTDRLAARHQFRKWRQAAVGAHCKVGAGGTGRSLPSVPGRNLLAPCIPVEQETAAAESRRLWFDQVEHPLCGDRGVECIATQLQNFRGGIRSMGICRDNHEAGAGCRGSRRETAGGLGLGGLRPNPAGARQNGQRQEKTGSPQAARLLDSSA